MSFDQIGHKIGIECQHAFADGVGRTMQIGISPVLVTTLTEVIDAAIELSGAAFGNIQLLDAENRLRIVAYRGFPDWWIEYWNTVSAGHGVCGSSLALGERVIVEDIEKSPIFVGTPALDIQLKAGVRAVQSTPLRGRSSEVVGMLSTHYRTPYWPDAKAVKMLDLLATHAATLIENARSEQALRDSERMHRVLFDSLDEGVCLFERQPLRPDGLRDYRYIAMNPAMQAMFGIPVLSGRSIRDNFPHQVEEWCDDFDRVLETGHSIRFERESALQGKFLEIFVARVEDGPKGRLLAVMQDITVRKQDEAALLAARQNAEQANQSKSKFLAAASHDLRQPLAAIYLYLDVLSRASLNSDILSIVARLKHSSETLSVMLNTLLDVANLDSGTITLTFSALHTSELFSWIEDEFGKQFKAHGLRLDYFHPHGDLVLHTDFALLKSILINLLGNTLKYCDKSRALVTLRRRGQRALLQVWDNGIGIAPENIGHIFDEYFQIGNSERDMAKGLGLGLSIVARKAKLIGGEIECRSQLGKGSVFSLWLPLAENVLEASNGNHPSSRIATDPEHFVGKRLMLIEDNADLREAMVQTLRMSGFDVTAVGDAESALTNPELARMDFFISDLRLPGNMDGLQLLDGIERGKQAPIKGVLLTGDTLIHELPSSGVGKWKILIKPCSPKLLLKALEELD